MQYRMISYSHAITISSTSTIVDVPISFLNPLRPDGAYGWTIVSPTLLVLGRPSVSIVTVWMHDWYVLLVGFVVNCPAS